MCDFWTSGPDVLTGLHPKSMSFIEVQLSKNAKVLVDNAQEPSGEDSCQQVRVLVSLE